MYLLSYLMLMPDFICVENGIQHHCLAEETCSAKFNRISDGKITGFFINAAAETSLHNWVESLGMRCASGFEIGFFASMFFIGNVLGAILLAK